MVLLRDNFGSEESVKLPSFWELHAHQFTHDQQDADAWCSPPPSSTTLSAEEDDEQRVDEDQAVLITSDSSATAAIQEPSMIPSSNDSYWALVSSESSSSSSSSGGSSVEDFDEEASLPSATELPSDIIIEQPCYPEQQDKKPGSRKRSTPSSSSQLHECLRHSAHALVQKMKQTQETRAVFLQLQKEWPSQHPSKDVKKNEQQERDETTESSASSSSAAAKEEQEQLSRKRRRVEETRQALFESLITLTTES